MKKFKIFQMMSLAGFLCLTASTCSQTADDAQAQDKSAIGIEEVKSVASNIQEPINEAPMTNVKAIIKTPMGSMTIKLYDETPLHRDNFVKLVKEGFYNDLLFHRVIKNFMIQGGDPNSKGATADARLGSGGPGYTIPAEFNPKFIHKKGALSAARQGDQVNPEKSSSGSQFYVVQGQIYPPEQLKGMEQRMQAQMPDFKYNQEHFDAYASIGGTPHLDQNYTVFGEVIEGLDVIDKIAAVKTAPGDRPIEDVKMTIELVE